jgi:hypothetical protein
MVTFKMSPISGTITADNAAMGAGATLRQCGKRQEFYWKERRDKTRSTRFDGQWAR